MKENEFSKCMEVVSGTAQGIPYLKKFQGEDKERNGKCTVWDMKAEAARQIGNDQSKLQDILLESAHCNKV